MKKEEILMLGILGLIFIFGIVFLISSSAVVYAANGNMTACNDSNNNSGYLVGVYHDNDHDGYGAGNLTQLCLANASSIPAGYADNNLDCNDNDSNVWKNIVVYRDIDGDGYGEFIPIPMCSLSVPSGYSNVSGDCADTNLLIHPNAPEICDGFDNNCNGKIDEGFFNSSNKTCYVGVGECRNAGVYVCNNFGNGTFCNAKPKKPSKEICDGKDNDCNGVIDDGDVCNNTNVSFVVYSPNQTIFSSNNIPINISLISNYGFKASIMSYIDYFLKTKPKEVILCKNCNGFGNENKKSLNLRDGNHTLSFSAVFNGTRYNNNISILIDGKKPRLYLPRIRIKDYTNGSFNINYDEDNLKDVILYYENQSFVNLNCSSGKNKACSIFANLSKYDGNTISYSFKVEDVAGNSEQTKNMMAEVDTTPPKFEVNYSVVGNYVFFSINVTEKNFNDVSYFDNSYGKAKWKVLCSALNDGICEQNIRLSTGEHNVTIRVTDKAGNSATEDV